MSNFCFYSPLNWNSLRMWCIWRQSHMKLCSQISLVDEHLTWNQYIWIILLLLLKSTAPSERRWEWERGCQRGREGERKVINISSNSSLNKIAGATSYAGRRAVIKSKKKKMEGYFFTFSLYLFLFSDHSRFISVPLCPSSFNNISTSSISVFHFLLPLF